MGVEMGVGVEVGGAEHATIGELVLRGFGAPVAKSVELLSLSVQPPAARKSAVVLLGAGAAAV